MPVLLIQTIKTHIKMDYFDKKITDIISESDNITLLLKGLICLNGKKFQSVKIGNYGTANILTVEKTFKGPGHDGFHNGNGHGLLFTIYIIKDEKVGISAFLKAVSCARGIVSYLINTRNKHFPFDIKLVLVGKEIDKSGAFAYLSDIFCFDSNWGTRAVVGIDFFTYNYSIEGLRFVPECGFKLKDEGF